LPPVPAHLTPIESVWDRNLAAAWDSVKGKAAAWAEEWEWARAWALAGKETAPSGGRFFMSFFLLLIYSRKKKWDIIFMNINAFM
jgi:hypothetical protein